MLEAGGLYGITEQYMAERTKLRTDQSIHGRWKELNPKPPLHSFWKKIVALRCKRAQILVASGSDPGS